MIATSKDGKALIEGKHFYLTVIGPTKKKSHRYSSSRNALRNQGEGPLFAQVMKGEIILKRVNSAEKFQITALNPDGSKGCTLYFRPTKGGMVFDLSQGRSHVYEVRVLE